MTPFISNSENAAFLSLVTGFLAFLVYCRTVGVFGPVNYFARVAKIHLAFTLLSIAAFAAWCFLNAIPLADTLANGIALAVLFVLLYYGFFLQIIGLVKKSVSVGLLLRVAETGHCPLDTLVSSYAEGKGTDYLVETRIEQMESLGWAKRNGNTLRVTALGKKINSLYLFLKHFFGLETPFERVSR